MAGIVDLTDNVAMAGFVNFQVPGIYVLTYGVVVRCMSTLTSSLVFTGSACLPDAMLHAGQCWQRRYSDAYRDSRPLVSSRAK